MIPDMPRRIDHPAAWLARDMAEPERWQETLAPPVVAELLSEARRIAADGNAAIAAHAIDPARLPRVAQALAEIERLVMEGRGFVLLRGLDPALDDLTLKACYWVMANLLGRPVSQNSYGERLCDVRDTGKRIHEKRVRGYETNAHLKFHTDRCDLVGLLCLRGAKQGGVSRICSAISVYNELMARRPDLVERLVNGLYCMRNEAGGGAGGFYRVPVLSLAEGVLSCRYSRNNMDTALRFGAPYAEIEKEALEAFDALASDPRLHVDMALERGDIQLINNYTTLHARTEFEDFPEPDLKRCLVRVWIRSLSRRKVGPHFEDYGGIPATLAEAG